MRKYLNGLALAAGLFIGLSPFLGAQTVARIFGTYNGAPIAITTTSAGSLNVSVTGAATDLTTKSQLSNIDGTNFTPTLAGAGAGNLSNGVYSYKFTVTTSTGETAPGAATPTVTVVNAAANGKVTVKVPYLLNPALQNRLNIYRTVHDGSVYKLLTSGVDFDPPLFEATFLDNVADASLGATAPTTNTTLQTMFSFTDQYFIGPTTTNFGGPTYLVGSPTADTGATFLVHDALTPTSNASNLAFYAGSGVAGLGGNIHITSGSSISNDGGNLIFEAGSSTSANGGTITVAAGPGGGSDGGVQLWGTTTVRNAANNAYAPIKTLSYYLQTVLTFSGAVPTISSGFGSSPSVTAGTATAFRLNVGTGGAASTGVVALPTASTGWNCNAYDVTTPDSFVTNQTASTTGTASFKNYSRTLGTAVAWTASDILAITCTAF